jgi:TonB family protein
VLLVALALLAGGCARSGGRAPLTDVLDLRSPDTARLGAYWVLVRGVPPKPVYDDRGRAVTGHVDLEFTVDSDGRVRGVYIVGEEPNRALGRSVSAAMSRWQYAPTPENTDRQPVRASMSFTMGTVR